MVAPAGTVTPVNLSPTVCLTPLRTPRSSACCPVTTFPVVFFSSASSRPAAMGITSVDLGGVSTGALGHEISKILPSFSFGLALLSCPRAVIHRFNRDGSTLPGASVTPDNLLGVG
jgi:hypothetical protein